MNYIGKIIRDARVLKKISQEELANTLGVTRQAISNWENNKNLPDLLIIFDLCKALKIDEKKVFKVLENSLKNNKKIIKSEKKKIIKKAAIIFSVLITIFIFITVTLLMIIKRNQFEVYKISLDTDKFQITNGIFIKSKINNYFQIYSIDTDEYIYSVKIYSIKGGVENLILESSGDGVITINERYGYSEFFNDIDEDYEDLFIEIQTLSETGIDKYNYKLNIDVIMNKKSLLYFKNEEIDINNKQNDNITEEKLGLDLYNKLIINNYRYDSKLGSFVKNDSFNSSFYYNSFNNLIKYMGEIDNNILSVNYNIKNNFIVAKIFSPEQEKNILNYSYFFDNPEDKRLFCITGDCKDYEKYNKIVLDEWENLNAS